MNIYNQLMHPDATNQPAQHQPRRPDNSLNLDPAGDGTICITRDKINQQKVRCG